MPTLAQSQLESESRTMSRKITCCELFVRPSFDNYVTVHLELAYGYQKDAAKMATVYPEERETIWDPLCDYLKRETGSTRYVSTCSYSRVNLQCTVDRGVSNPEMRFHCLKVNDTDFGTESIKMMARIQRVRERSTSWASTLPELIELLRDGLKAKRIKYNGKFCDYRVIDFPSAEQWPDLLHFRTQAVA